MAITTPNYYLPEFEDKEAIDLINVYNKAMQIIDNQLYIINEKIDYALAVMMQHPDTDKKLDESSIQKARIGSSGYVYIARYIEQ